MLRRKLQSPWWKLPVVVRIARCRTTLPILLLPVLVVITRHTTTTTTSASFLSSSISSSSPAYIIKAQLLQQLQLHQRCLYQSPKDWDAILSDAEDGDGWNTATTTPLSWKQKIPHDMKYNLRNCERTNQNFKAIQNAGGPGADIYGSVQPPAAAAEETTEGVFWFLGKVSHVSDLSSMDAIRRLYPMIQQHAANLRPLDLFGAVTNQELDLWYAPIHSEFDVAYNRPTCVFTKIVPPTEAEGKEMVQTIKSSHVGFQGEIYEPGEEGFRTLRYTMDGTPCRPEITGPTDANVATEDNVPVDPYGDGDKAVPDDEQMEQIQKALEGKDINAIYEEQERRRRSTGTTEA